MLIIVLLAERMLFPSISPRFEILYIFIELTGLVIALLLLERCLKKPNNIPTVMEDRM